MPTRPSQDVMATDPIAPAKGPSADGKPFLRMHETRDPAKLRSTHWPKADPARRAYPQLPEHIIFDSRGRSQVQQKERPNGRSRSFRRTSLRLVHVMRMRPAAVAADVPAKVPPAIAMGMAVTMTMAATHQQNVCARIDWHQRQCR